MSVKELCRKNGFSEVSYNPWRSTFGGMSVPDAKRLKELKTGPREPLVLRARTQG